MTGQPSITCPVCGMTSYSPEDIRQGFCGKCHRFTSPPPEGELLALHDDDLDRPLRPGEFEAMLRQAFGGGS